MKCVAVINQKGGVGKTTTTVNLGAGLVQAGKRVLLLDMDPQANLTLHVDRAPDLEAKTMTHLLVENEPIRNLIVPSNTAGLDVIPADTSLSGVEQVLANRIGRETILREAIEDFVASDAEGYDYLFMDCPPSLGVLSANALVCATEVIVPMQAEYFAMQGMTKLMEVVELVKKRLNPELEISFILACMVDQRTNLSQEVIGEIERHFDNILAKTWIRSNVKLAEAPSFGATIFEHAPESNGAVDYAEFAHEFLVRHGEAEPRPEEPDEEEYEDEEEDVEEPELVTEEHEAEVEDETPQPQPTTMPVAVRPAPLVVRPPVEERQSEAAGND